MKLLCIHSATTISTSLGSTVQMGIFVWHWVSSHLHLSLQALFVESPPLSHLTSATSDESTAGSCQHISPRFHWGPPVSLETLPASCSSTVLDVGTSGQTARVTRVSAASGGTKRGLQGVEMIVSFHLFVLSFNGKRCLSHFCWWWNAGLNAKKITITVAKILEIKSICSNHAAFLLLPFLVLPFFFTFLDFFFFPPKRFHKLFLIRKTKNFRICMTGKKIWGVTPGLLLQQCSSNYTSAICPSSCLCTCLVT